MTDAWDLTGIIEKLLEFRNERDWEQFHRPKEVVTALSIEISELQNIFLWKNEEEVKKVLDQTKTRSQIIEEVADIAIYLSYFAYDNKINLHQAILRKIEKNKEKYPPEKFRGKAR
jgi:NTP pyrophosphatase (non-canonical NTP hydrolase)